MTSTDHVSEPPYTADELRAAIARVCDSPVFESARAHQDFLRFLLQVTLAGQDAEITKEQVARDIFDQPLGDDLDGFLTTELLHIRAKLAEHYRQIGHLDPLRLDVGVDSVELRVSTVAPEDLSRHKAVLATLRRNWTLLLAAVLLLAGLLGSQLMKIEKSPHQDPQRVAVESTLGNLPDTAQMSADEIIDLGLPMMFPFINLEGHKQATAMFERAMQEDPNLARGPASATFSLSNTGLLSLGSGRAKRYFQQAETYLAKAQALDPDDPWVIAATAWHQYVNRDRKGAWELMEQARSMRPDNPYFSYYAGFLAYTLADFETARSVAFPDREDLDKRVLYGHRITYAAASFFTQDYDETISVLESMLEEGAVSTVYTMAFLAAAYQITGRDSEARSWVTNMRETYPNLNPSLLVGSFTEKPGVVTPFVEALTAAGWDFGDILID